MPSIVKTSTRSHNSQPAWLACIVACLALSLPLAAEAQRLGRLAHGVHPRPHPHEEIPTTRPHSDEADSPGGRPHLDDVPPDSASILRQIDEADSELRLSATPDGELQVHVRRSAMDPYVTRDLASLEPVPPADRPSLAVESSALRQPKALSQLLESGQRLHVRDGLDKLNVRVAPDPTGNLEVLIDYRPGVSVSGAVYPNLGSLTDAAAKGLVSKMRVVLLADPRDVKQVAAYRKVAGARLFVPRSATELDAFLEANRKQFFVVAGHSDEGAFKVLDARGNSLYAVPFGDLAAKVRASESAQLNLTCSAACNAPISGPTRLITSRDVIDGIKQVGDRSVVDLLHDLSIRSGVPMVIRHDLKDGVTLVAEADKTRPWPKGTPFKTIRFEAKAKSAVDLAPSMISMPTISEAAAQSQAAGRISLYVVAIIFLPLLIWGGLFGIILYNFDNPTRLVDWVRDLCGRSDWDDPLEEGARFLTSRFGVFLLGPFALVWSLALIFIAFFGDLAIAFQAVPIAMAAFVMAWVYEASKRGSMRVAFTSLAAFKESGRTALVRACVWAIPAAVVYFVFAAVDSVRSGDYDIDFVFDGNEIVAWIGALTVVAVGGLDLVRGRERRHPDLVDLARAGVLAPWIWMRNFDERRARTLGATHDQRPRGVEPPLRRDRPPPPRDPRTLL